ncbi:MAG: UDP-N-acetylglucosamine pyrophosphorylase [Clostridia bacterium]|nr:UDP-N-acetylglucosamine pyrophosphorylase [Clostridia bacterium]
MKTKALYEKIPRIFLALFLESEYPWQILPKIKAFISDIAAKEKLGYTCIGENVWVGKNVKIYPTATIEGPCIIGDETVIRPGAFIRGSVIIGENCVIGNSTEIKNSVLLDGVQAPHYNYIGDSVLGYRSHVGAGVVLSNLKGGGSEVVIHFGKENIKTEMRKVGAFLGDEADLGCGTVANPGTVVGKRTRVYPNVVLRGIYPCDSIVKETNKIVKKD